MNPSQEYEKAIQEAWSTLIMSRKKWGLIGNVPLSLVIIFPILSWIFKYEPPIYAWVALIFITASGKYYANHQLKQAEEKYFGEFPALIPENE